MKYDVTIGIPVYKSRPYIKQAMTSALNQTYPSIEFLVIDDAGNDGSVDIIRQLVSQHLRGKDVHIISHVCNQGVSASRNEIIEKAQGEFLYFMDSDDTIAVNTIDLLMRNIHQYHAEIAFGSYEKIEISSEKTVYQYPSLQLLGEDHLACFAYRKYGGIQASACNYLVQTSILHNHHLRFIDADYWEDLVFTFELVTYISRAVLLPDITYSYHCHKHSLSHYQSRNLITKDEVMKNVRTIDYLKGRTPLLYNKVYYPQRCFHILMTDFYMACHILKYRSAIQPSIIDSELKAMMSHPASLRQILSFHHGRLKNFCFFLLSKLPAKLCVSFIWCLGKIKKLV
jgi:glycosyltransferase involved in cell wall biosynthesis